MDIKAAIQEILLRGELLSLGIVDEGGVWVCDLAAVPDEKYNLYWISKKTTRHSQAVKKNPKVAATVSLHDTPSGVQIEGTAEEVEPIAEIIKQIMIRRGKEPVTTLEEGNALYKLTPLRFELLNLPLFGLEKKEYIP